MLSKTEQTVLLRFYASTFNEEDFKNMWGKCFSGSPSVFRNVLTYLFFFGHQGKELQVTSEELHAFFSSEHPQEDVVIEFVDYGVILGKLLMTGVVNYDQTLEETHPGGIRSVNRFYLSKWWKTNHSHKWLDN